MNQYEKMRMKHKPKSRLIRKHRGPDKVMLCVACGCSSMQSFSGRNTWKDVQRKLKRQGWVKAGAVKGWLCPGCALAVAEMILKHSHDP